jgi:hypothetical protein
MSLIPGGLNPNGNPVGNPRIWTRDGDLEIPFEKAVAALLAVPKGEADAEEAKRPRRSRKTP